ncbi:MAG TPA: hypothetical protein VMT11_13340 [Myxococcaceae bacterium]|nr:hypothetical protein [Myxococcaceae bacterium]
MLPTLRRFVPAALLLTASGALADSPLPKAEVTAREITTHTPAVTPAADDQLRTLTRTVESLETEVQQLQAKQDERSPQVGELGGPNDHPLWP